MFQMPSRLCFFQSHHVINDYKTVIWKNRHGKEKWLQYAGATGLPNKKMDIILKRLQERAKLYASIYFLPHMDLHTIHKWKKLHTAKPTVNGFILNNPPRKQNKKV